MAASPKILVWNARGLNSRAKRRAVFQVVSTSAASVVCIQETKLHLITSSIVLQCLGAEFSDFFFLPAEGTRGGILLAWKPGE
ncbi:hypothetical protein BRADI_2g25972v3, partial [Brachypodium distachyon]